MISALLDSNVILDAVAHRKPYNENAETIFMLSAERKIKGYITANSLTDIYYIAKKQLSDFSAREALRHLFKVFIIIDVTGEDCKEALEFAMPDFEDAVIVFCGAKADVDYIITRDADFLKSENTDNIVPPEEFLRIFEDSSR